MQPTKGAARNLNSLSKETGSQNVRVVVGNGAPCRLDEIRGGKGSEDEIMERKDNNVLNGSATVYCNGAVGEEEDVEDVTEVEEGGSFSEADHSSEHEDRDYQRDTGGQPLPYEGRVSTQVHADSEWQVPSTSNIFLKSTNSSRSRAAVLKSYNSMTGAEMARGCSKCPKCNGTGKFSVEAAGDYRETEKSRRTAERDHGLLLEEGSKPRPVNQRRPFVAEISCGMWLQCFFRFFLGSIAEDLVTSNPVLTSFNVILVPISFAFCFFGDMLFFVVAIFYDLVFMAIYIFLYILWALNAVVAICWHFLQLSSFSTRVAKTIFEFLWDMRAVYKDERLCKLSPSRYSTHSG